VEILFIAPVEDLDFLAFALENHFGVAPEKRIAAHVFALLDTLEQEGVFTLGNFLERRDRRLHVGQDFPPDRHQIPLSATFSKRF
jgi:hypothetical protein